MTGEPGASNISCDERVQPRSYFLPAWFHLVSIFFLFGNWKKKDELKEREIKEEKKAGNEILLYTYIIL